MTIEEKLKILKETLTTETAKNSVYKQVAKMAADNAESCVGLSTMDCAYAWIDVMDFCKKKLIESKERLEKTRDSIITGDEA